jgi:phospholipid/cholesterol/gamma-HCH transport system substrate-binding protein
VNYTLVGAFVLILCTALIAGLLWLVSGGLLHRQVDLYLSIVDESVNGLSVSAPVKYNGVDVGQVRSIALDATNTQRVLLTFAIKRGTPITVDTRAVLKTQGLTGIAYVDLSGGGHGAAPLVASVPGGLPVIPTKASLSARLEDVLTAGLAKLERTTARVDELLSPANLAALSSTLADVATVSRTVAARSAAIDGAISHAGRTLAHTDRAAEQLTPAIVRIERAADALETMADDTALASRQVNQTVAAVGADAKRLTADSLQELPRLLAELQALSASVRRVSEAAERNPASALFGRAGTPLGPGETAPQPAAR